jgi:hypothetical protein
MKLITNDCAHVMVRGEHTTHAREQIRQAKQPPAVLLIARQHAAMTHRSVQASNNKQSFIATECWLVVDHQKSSLMGYGCPRLTNWSIIPCSLQRSTLSQVYIGELISYALIRTTFPFSLF